MGGGSVIPSGSTVCVPYVCRDSTGLFTKILIEELETNSDLIYRSCPSKYILEVTLGSPRVDPIGFRYEQNYEGVIGKRLVTSEEQITLTASVALRESSSRRCVIPPFCVVEEIDFDFEPETSPQNETSFSLGQLDFENAADIAAREPLYKKLSKKIVDYLNAWF